MDKLELKERPILFNSEMVQKVLSGVKTQTRRIMNPQPVYEVTSRGIPAQPQPVYIWRPKKDCEWYAWESMGFEFNPSISRDCPYGDEGDRLWVRETWARYAYGNPKAPMGIATDTCYKADRDDLEIKWRPSIHMPRWASRITLEITSVRVERVQDISQLDAMAEGTQGRRSFLALWDSLYAEKGYGVEVNPWLWVIEFKKVEEK